MSIITKKQGTLEYLVSQGISVPHCFTTRYGGVSVGSQESLNLAFGRGDSMENVEANIRILAKELSFDETKLVLTRQTHSDIIRVVTDADAQGFCHKVYPECDGLITCTPGVALMVFTADCTPILLHDPVTGAVGAVHAGWRGTAQLIAAKAVKKMAAEFGCDPENIRAAIGPNIGFDHFETDAEVPAAMVAAYGEAAEEFIRQKGSKYFLDLKQINALALQMAGVEHIEISDACTYCQHERFWSHRFTDGDRGSQGAVILCREGER